MKDSSTIERFEDLPNVGPAIAKDLRTIGLRVPSDLESCDPYEMFQRLQTTTGIHHDPCVLDVFISVVRFLNGAPPKPWWEYTQERKKTLARPEHSATG